MIRDCARCGRRASKSAEWSDGPICRTCYERAMRVCGGCPRCGTDRLLPGRYTDGTPICRDANDRPPMVRASTAASPFGGGPAIAVLEIDLRLPWVSTAEDEPIVLGDLPVDRCGMVLGDALALDSWTGDGHPSTDGLADVEVTRRSPVFSSAET
ncbi:MULTISPECIES: hypothetical protein [Streptomyces]|uniref:DUF35 domain-containing protein n=1 Tax=Streptomyces evansiae TaxID=3075535 RepID=A0ABU2QWQ0_9ACTN|nr:MULTISPECIES: hypothetical protein [unclassified Streptomyces]MDT0407460.1 hypothetical protein [Streptomyces sp. DSM 41979]SCD49466.1 hypothetical protein GA0115252_10776 [Streptomyces sp. DfronAA-171]